MDSHYTYLLVDAGALLIPFVFSFHRRLAFYKKWPALWLPMLITAAVFIAWDVLFTQHSVWSFNPTYTLAPRMLSLPLEEWLFFIFIPYCCAFVYTSIQQTSLGKKMFGWGWTAAIILSATLASVAVANHGAYTRSAMGGCGAGLLLAYILRAKNLAFNIGLFLVCYTVCMLPFFIVNGILTAMPVVVYNDAENLGIRLYTIPVEDIFYGMLLVLGNIWGMEYRKNIPVR